MGYWLCAHNDIEDLKASVWQWGATMPLIAMSNILEPDVELVGERMVFADADSCSKLADWLETHVVDKLTTDSRVNVNGEIVTESDDHVFHRDDLAENYSVDRQWLLSFVAFLRECGGFNTVG